MANYLFKRKIYARLVEWKQNRNGKTAALVQGARRIGKSTIVQEFAKNEYESYILIDFSKISQEENRLFEDLSDLDYFFLQLQGRHNVVLHERRSVIIFDEVQLQPLARQAIKHLVADGRYDYIETGSLISIRKNVKNIVIPSEETKFNMYPMDFEEFCWATNNTARIDLLRTFYSEKRPLGAAHRAMMRLFRLYMLVGGMPQAVSEYLQTNNLSQVDEVKREILRLYDDDLRKIDASGRASLLFKSIPAQLSSNANRYMPSRAIKGARNSRAEELTADLVDSMTVNRANHVSDPNIGMSLHINLNKYKLFLADTGLFVTLAFNDKDYTENTIYSKLLSDKLAANLGYVYENMVAQMLKAKGDGLFYFTFENETATHYYEVDFLLSRGNKVCPIEVKSSGYKTHASLDAFVSKFHARVGTQYLVYTKDYAREGSVEYLPIYLLPFV